MDQLTIDDLLKVLPVEPVMTITSVKRVLFKVLPLLKDTTPVVHVVKVLKLSNYQTEFMPLVLNLTSRSSFYLVYTSC